MVRRLSTALGLRLTEHFYTISAVPGCSAHACLISFVFVFTDLVLLSTLEFSRLGESLLPIVRSQPSSSASISTSGVAKALLSSRQHSDLFLRLSAYCGGFNSNTQKHRYDTAGALEQVRTRGNSCLPVYAKLIGLTQSWVRRWCVSLSYVFFYVHYIRCIVVTDLSSSILCDGTCFTFCLLCVVPCPCKQITALHDTLNTAASSAMLYTVEPPLSVAEFTSAAPSDLQVKIAVLLFVSCALARRSVQVS
jgi:hypothetical protein